MYDIPEIGDEMLTASRPASDLSSNGRKGIMRISNNSRSPRYQHQVELSPKADLGNFLTSDLATRNTNASLSENPFIRWSGQDTPQTSSRFFDQRRSAPTMTGLVDDMTLLQPPQSQPRAGARGHRYGPQTPFSEM